MISFPCPKCGTTLKAPEEKAGAHSKCMKCGCPVQVPAPPAGGQQAGAVPPAPTYPMAILAEPAIPEVLPAKVPSKAAALRFLGVKYGGVPVWVLAASAVAALYLCYLCLSVMVPVFLGVGRDAANSPLDDAGIVDFIDNTPKFKGKTLTIRLTVGSIDGTLRDCRGQEVEFHKYARSASLEVVILIPNSLELPNAQLGDDVIVTFVCKDGDLRHGNEATQIKRGR
jgi:hypothetical protein